MQNSSFVLLSQLYVTLAVDTASINIYLHHDHPFETSIRLGGLTISPSPFFLPFLHFKLEEKSSVGSIASIQANGKVICEPRNCKTSVLS
jgi:hypothetical protein